ncbi:MAG: hypothetical protein EZS28_054440, partial [Streblomastix strix]
MPYIQIMSKVQDQQQNEKDTTSNSNFNSQRYNIKSIQYMQSDQNDVLMSQCNLRDLNALSPHDQNDGTLHDMNESVRSQMNDQDHYYGTQYPDTDISQMMSHNITQFM